MKRWREGDFTTIFQTMKKLIFFSFALSALFFQACKKDNIPSSNYTATANCSGTTPVYVTDIKPILDNHCATSGCHNSSSSAAGIRLDDFSNAKNEFMNGKALCTVYHDCTPMPQGKAKLSDSDILLLTCWVKDGAPQ